YTSAPVTGRPLHADTWNFTVRSVVERVIGVGDADCPSISSRAGGETTLTSTGPVPVAGQPLTLVGGVTFFCTTAVGTDVAWLDPSEFFAVTRTRIVLPTSTPFSVYVLSLAPPMFEQLPPVASQRRHWYAKLIGAVPFHWPGLAVTTLPSCGVPEMVGGDWFV